MAHVAGLVRCIAESARTKSLHTFGMALTIAFTFYMMVFHSLSNLPLDQALYFEVHYTLLCLHELAQARKGGAFIWEGMRYIGARDTCMYPPPHVSEGMRYIGARDTCMYPPPHVTEGMRYIGARDTCMYPPLHVTEGMRYIGAQALLDAGPHYCLWHGGDGHVMACTTSRHCIAPACCARSRSCRVSPGLSVSLCVCQQSSALKCFGGASLLQSALVMHASRPQDSRTQDTRTLS